MAQQTGNKLIKIGVFYDGNYFAHVSNYYNYEHERKARLSISGLHEFIRSQVAEYENVDKMLCQIVDAHYFRGRLSYYDAQERNRLLSDRIFDDILMNEGVNTHYLPLKTREGKIVEEKGVDVWLALEAYELSLSKKYDVFVLIASDSDYVPLMRKLNTLGIRLMVLGWDLEYTDERTGRIRKTVTSIDLLQEVSYPVSMHEIIDNKVRRNDSLVNDLFVNKDRKYYRYNPEASYMNYDESAGMVYDEEGVGEWHTGAIFSLKNGYGFISKPPNNVYFHYTALEAGDDFNELQDGEFVEYLLQKNDRGQDIATAVRRKTDDSGWEAESESASTYLTD